MRLGKTALTAVAAAAVIAAFAMGYAVRGTPEADDHAGHGAEATVAEDGSVIWTCSMHPQIQLPEPGNCPICFMELIPVERRDESARTSLREIRLTEEARILADIATEPVQRLDVEVETRMVGKVDYDETRVRAITAWTGGRVDRMYVDYTGMSVRRGQPMVWIYSPELLTAQVELIEAEKAIRDLGASNLDLVRKSAARTAEAAREKLRLLGLTRAQVEAVLREGKASDHITLHAPQGGVVLAKNVDEGEYVKTGQSIYTIADLSVVWVVLEAYESDLPWVETGRQVEFQTEAYPGKTFRGKVVYIDPVVNEKTRTVRVRLEVPNADGSLKPGMLVRATQQKQGRETAGEPPLVIPATAPLITGRRAVVYVADPSIPGRYEGREVVLGGRAGSYYIVLGGLDEGELVVTRGNFKIDSALQIVARPSMMTPATGTGATDTGAADTGADTALPDLFVSKAHLLHDTFGALAQDVASGDLERTHLAFGRFHKELRLIDGSGLTGRAARLWREYAMLLGNDAILGAEAPDKRRLDEIFAEMKAHYAGFRNAFALDAPVDEADRQFDAPESFRRQLGQAFVRYETLAAALVADDMSGAVQAADALAGALGQVGMDGLSGPAHNVWMEALALMNDGLAAIREAGDIVAVRAGFEPVSAGMTRAVIRLGIEAATPVYELFCPMAFDYEGATWLQRDEDIRNPYMGQAMPACGEVNRQLAR